jgi:hypothetical protein
MPVLVLVLSIIAHLVEEAIQFCDWVCAQRLSCISVHSRTKSLNVVYIGIVAVDFLYVFCALDFLKGLSPFVCIL